MGGLLRRPGARPGDRPGNRPGAYHTMTATAAGQGAPTATTTSTSTSAEVAAMGPADRLLAGSTWTRDDLALALQAVSTLLLLYWAVTEVRG